MLNLYQFICVAALLLSSTYIVSLLRVRSRSGLRKIPGPRLAAYSRLWNVKNAASGDAHEGFRRLHEKYDKLVRVGPNHVAISDPAMIPVIYGTSNKYLKTGFYEPFATPYAGESMHSMFSTADITQHRALKKSVANKYSLSSMKDFEPQVNDYTNNLALSSIAGVIITYILGISCVF